MDKKVPSDAQLKEFWRQLTEAGGDEVDFARALLARYGQPAQPVVSVTLDFDQVGRAGPFPVVDGCVFVPAETVVDLVRMAQPAASVGLLCRKCGEQTSVSISSARLVTHYQNGMPRDPRDIASDPEGKLIHEVDKDLAGYKPASPISDEMMDLADRLGSEYDKVDPRAWEHLLVYAPKPILAQPAASAELPVTEQEEEAWRQMERRS